MCLERVTLLTKHFWARRRRSEFTSRVAVCQYDLMCCIQPTASTAISLGCCSDNLPFNKQGQSLRQLITQKLLNYGHIHGHQVPDCLTSHYSAW